MKQKILKVFLSFIFFFYVLQTRSWAVVPMPVFNIQGSAMTLNLTEKMIYNIYWGEERLEQFEKLNRGLGSSVGVVEDIATILGVSDQWGAEYMSRAENIAQTITSSIDQVAVVKGPCDISIDQEKLKIVLATVSSSLPVESWDVLFTEVQQILTDEIREDYDLESYVRQSAIKSRIFDVVINFLAQNRSGQTLKQSLSRPLSSVYLPVIKKFRVEFECCFKYADMVTCTKTTFINQSANRFARCDFKVV